MRQELLHHPYWTRQIDVDSWVTSCDQDGSGRQLHRARRSVFANRRMGQKILLQTLRAMARDGLVDRTVCRAVVESAWTVLGTEAGLATDHISCNMAAQAAMRYLDV